jgi:choline dehydrogenase-like flavoprotein
VGTLVGCGKPAGPGEDYEVCIVGSGFAGTMLGLRLARQGIRTVIVEAGSGLSGNFGHANTGAIDYPLHKSRAIAAGGTSRLWAGVLARMTPSDLRLRSEFGIGVDWPVTYDQLAPYYCEAESELHAKGYPAVVDAEPPRSCDYPHRVPVPYKPPSWQDEEVDAGFFFVARSARDGNDRSPVRLAEEVTEFASLPSGEFLTDLQVTRAVTLDGSRVDHLEARGPDGSVRRIHARVFVLAAGVVETARILLLSHSRWFPNGIGNQHDLIGRHLIIHPNFAVKLGAPAFAGLSPGYHRTLSYNDAFRREGLNACHFQLHRTRSGIIVIKYQPEIEARPSNRMTLSSTERDPLGDPLPVLDLSYSERDQRTVDRALELVKDQLERVGVGWDQVETKQTWRYHPSGTCRMGVDPESGVVDARGQVFGIDNLFVSGTAVFPSLGTVNPALTIVALTLRLADHVASVVR